MNQCPRCKKKEVKKLEHRQGYFCCSCGWRWRDSFLITSCNAIDKANLERLLRKEI